MPIPLQFIRITQMKMQNANTQKELLNWQIGITMVSNLNERNINNSLKVWLSI